MTPRPRPPLLGARAARPPGPLWRARPLAWLILIVAAMALDHAAYVHLSVKTNTDLMSLEGKDWYRAFRILGFGGTWAAFGLALFLTDLSRRNAGERLPGGPPRRAVFLWLSIIGSAIAAETLKVLIGRMRPEDTGGAYALMPLARRLGAAHDLGCPSSHTAVAFAAAFALAVCFRPAAPVLIAGAVGCGLSRVLAGAHFLSDTVVAGAVAYAVTLLVWRLDARNNAGVGLGAAPAPGPASPGLPAAKLTPAPARPTTPTGAP